MRLTGERLFKVERIIEPTRVRVLMLKGEKGDKGEPGEVTSYNDIPDKPSVNGVTLEDDKSFEDLGLEVLDNGEIEALFNN